MGRTLRRFYAVARSDLCAVWYHSKVRAIPQRKKASMRELQISVLTLFRFHPNINRSYALQPRFYRDSTQFVVGQFIAFSPACGGVRGGTGDKSPPFRESETYYKAL